MPSSVAQHVYPNVRQECARRLPMSQFSRGKPSLFTPRVSPSAFAIGVAIALLVGTMASLIAMGALDEVPGQVSGKVVR